MLTIAPLLFEAENYLAQHDLDRAAALYKKARELDPESPLPRIGIARIALASGRFADGQLLLDAVLTHHPDSVEALTIRGVASEAMNDLEAAKRSFERALELLPTYAAAAYNLGRVLGLQQQWSAACVYLRRASQLLPNEPEVGVIYGTAAFRAGQFSESIDVLKRCIEAAPFFVGGYLTLVDVLVETGQLDDADALLAASEVRFPRRAIFRSKRAAIALRQGRATEALHHTRNQLAIDANDLEAWLMVSVLEMARLNIDAAEAAVHEVLRRDPKHWRAHYHLGGIYETLKLLELAQHAYRNAVALAPTEWQPKNNLATLLLEKSDLSATREARELLEHALTTAPACDRFLPTFNLALACLKLGDAGSSEQHARVALESTPKTHALAPTVERFIKNFA